MTTDTTTQFPHNIPTVEGRGDALVRVVELLEWANRTAPHRDPFTEIREALGTALAEFADDHARQARLLVDALDELDQHRFVVKHFEHGSRSKLHLVTCWHTLADAQQDRLAAGSLLGRPTSLVVL